MVIIAGTVSIKPEFREAAIAAMLEVVNATHPEAGCIAYDFWNDLGDANRFHIYEEWDKQASLDAHMKQAHTQKFLSLIPSYVAGPMNVNRYEVEAGGSLL